MDKFQRGKIYAIRAPNCDMVYIGSTISTLRHRISEHRSKLKRHKAGKGLYYASFKLLEIEGFHIELVENYPCADRNELNRREGQIMRETVGCINSKLAGQTKAEYKEANTFKVECECGGEYSRWRKTSHSRTKKHQAFTTPSGIPTTVPVSKTAAKLPPPPTFALPTP